MSKKQQICGIYKITNLINNKCYIGQSIDINKRWHKHLYADSSNSVIHTAIKKYGKNNFLFEVIEECPVEALNDREIYWIQYYNSYKEGYNCTLGGDTGNHYNYEEIYTLWNSGLNCQEIQNKLNCNSSTITRALRYFDISEEQVRNRAVNKKQYVAIDIDTNKPLKIFNGSYEIYNFFNGKLSDVTTLKKNIENRYRMFGFYWEYLDENNIPKKELNEEEFLSYQQKQLKIYNTEQKLLISEKQRKVERPNRQRLKELIRTMPFTQIGKMYNVTDSAIRKWCDFENLPRKKSEINSYSDEEWNLI